MKKYVLTFIWDEQYEYLLLITKNRPEWQKGKLNGIGGKYEKSDRTIFHAATREIKEETDLEIDERDLRQFAEIVCTDCIVYCFSCVISKDWLEAAKSVTDERISVNQASYLKMYDYDRCIPNLEFIIPLSQRQDYYTVFYTD